MFVDPLAPSATQICTLRLHRSASAEDTFDRSGKSLGECAALNSGFHDYRGSVARHWLTIGCRLAYAPEHGAGAAFEDSFEAPWVWVSVCLRALDWYVLLFLFNWTILYSFIFALVHGPVSFHLYTFWQSNSHRDH